jgi:hypothetical protein
VAVRGDANVYRVLGTPGMLHKTGLKPCGE